MRLAHRVQKLERMAGTMWPLSPMDRLQTALNDAAIRLTGRDFIFGPGEQPALTLILEDVQESFVRKLSDGDLASLMAELETIVWRRHRGLGTRQAGNVEQL